MFANFGIFNLFNNSKWGFDHRGQNQSLSNIEDDPHLIDSYSKEVSRKLSKWCQKGLLDASYTQEWEQTKRDLTTKAQEILATEKRYSSQASCLIARGVVWLDLKHRLDGAKKQISLQANKVSLFVRFIHWLGFKKNQTLKQQEKINHFFNQINQQLLTLYRRLRETHPAFFDESEAANNDRDLDSRFLSLILEQNENTLINPLIAEITENDISLMISDELEYIAVQEVCLHQRGGVYLRHVMSILRKLFLSSPSLLVKKVEEAQKIYAQVEIDKFHQTISSEHYLLDWLSVMSIANEVGSLQEVVPPMQKPKEMIDWNIELMTLEQIKTLTYPGDFCLIPSGCLTHFVIIEFTIDENGLYSLTVFNTGEGIDKYHDYSITSIEDDEQILGEAKPFKIRGLTREQVFNDSTILSLANSLKEQKIDSLYQSLKQILINHTNSRDVSHTCPYYQLQKSGTCGYSAIRAWLQSRLTETEWKGYQSACFNHLAKQLQRVLSFKTEQLQLEEESFELMNMLEDAFEERAESRRIFKKNNAGRVDQTTKLLKEVEKLRQMYSS